MNKALLTQMIAEDYVNVQKHPTAPLFIYNYSAKAQYDRVWNEVTLACRGLIMDAAGNIVARPFQKFFNLGEMENQHVPNAAFEVYEKMDGSLGILYWSEGKPYIATRGSFSSDQALRANELLHNHYAHLHQNLSTEHTYLFEIIYPENRIVVDYHGQEALVLLGIVETKSGKELPLNPSLGFPVVKRYDGLTDLKKLKSLEEKNKEGFVVKWADGYRLKVKFEEYQRIHRIVTGISSISIWEFLKAGQDLTPFLERVPDEFYDWVKSQETKLLDTYKNIEDEAKSAFKDLGERKTTALYFQTCKHPAVLFKMLENKPYDHVIWKQLRPTFEKPYCHVNEE